MNVFEHYNILNQIGYLGDGLGFLRSGYSLEEQKVINYFQDLLLQHGFECKFDLVGNFSATISGKSGKYIEFGSHVDTVPNGGNFDGLAGVVAGYEAIIRYVENHELYHGLRLRIWRLEESATFKAVYAGSLAAFGQLPPKLLDNKFNNQTLKEAISALGYDTSCINNSQKTISQNEIDNILLHLELHIEQGKVLEVEKKQIGIVTSIRGNQRYIIVLTGEYDHSGTTPMGVDYRKDCNLALAYMLTELDGLKVNHPEIIQTFGIINSDSDYSKQFSTYTNSITKVSGKAYFSIDIRSSINNKLNSYSKLIEEKLLLIANKFGVKLEFINLGSVEAIEQLHTPVISLIEDICSKNKISCMKIPSGAGHDAAVIAKQKKSDRTTVPVNMLFIPCRNGVSHSPDEYAEYSDLENGVNVMYEIILRLSNENVI